MNGASIDFRAEINRYVDSKGLDISPEKINAINGVLNTFAVPDIEAGTVRYEWQRGIPTTLAEILAAETVGAPKRAEQAAPPHPAEVTKTAAARARLDELRSSRAADVVASIVAKGNPWARGTFNRTNQAIVTRHDPDAARELRQSAGANQC